MATLHWESRLSSLRGVHAVGKRLYERIDELDTINDRRSRSYLVINDRYREADFLGIHDRV